MNNDFTGLILSQRYEIGEKLGSGRIGIVFAAYDRHLGRRVAVKILKPEFAWSPEMVDDFIREARIIARLEHPSVLGVYHQGAQTIEDQRLVYLVMQLASGGTLIDRLEAGALTPHEAGRVLKQVCDALDYAHQREVLHLDVKPLNILFDEHGNALVADFGLARLLRGASRIKADTGFGTPIYMAPEQYFGQKAGPFSDVYALGVTLYQMLTGDLPDHNWSDLSHFLRLDHPLPSGVRSVIEKATQLAPDQRYRTAGELARAFEAAIALSPREWETEGHKGEPVPALEEVEEGPATRTSLLPKRKSSMPWILIGLVALVIVASLGTLGALQRRWERRAEATLAAISLILTASPTGNATPTAAFSSSAAAIPSPSATLAPVPSPTPCLVVSVDRLRVYGGPGEIYEVWDEVRRGDQLHLQGRSQDGAWWQVNYLGRSGWVRAQPVGANIEPTILPVGEVPPTPIASPTPTEVPAPSLPEPNTLLGLRNPGFERVQENFIPGWQWWAEDNYGNGEEYDSATSFDTPFFTRTPDPARQIDGPTLQVEATAFVNFRFHVFQVVSAPPSVTVRFQASARAFSEHGIELSAGVDPNGGPDCTQALWGDTLTIDQSSDVVLLIAPTVVVGEDGRVTVCLRAENVLPGRSNAAFFDNARLIANPE